MGISQTHRVQILRDPRIRDPEKIRIKSMKFRNSPNLDPRKNYPFSGVLNAFHVWQILTYYTSRLKMKNSNYGFSLPIHSQWNKVGKVFLNSLCNINAISQFYSIPIYQYLIKNLFACFRGLKWHFLVFSGGLFYWLFPGLHGIFLDFFDQNKNINRKQS